MDLEFAIEKTNLLVAGSGPRLVPSWIPGAAEAGASAAVRVYLIKAPRDAAATPVAVPRDCRCVFINPVVLDSWVNTHSSGPGRLSIDRRYLLVFMLLHEVGHLNQRTFGGDFADGALSQLNADISLAKAREEAADEFAAGLIRRSARETPPSAASLEANWVSNALTTLSWNMQAYRSLDEFGASTTGKQSVFFDQNLTHPNLAWRVLRSNYLIQQTAEAKALLEAFEDARRRSANSWLYRKGK